MGGASLAWGVWGAEWELVRRCHRRCAPHLRLVHAATSCQAGQLAPICLLIVGIILYNFRCVVCLRLDLEERQGRVCVVWSG